MTQPASFDPQQVLEALRTMFKNVERAGDSAYTNVLIAIIKRLASLPHPWRRKDYETIRDEEAKKITKLKGNDLTKIDRLLIGARLHLVVEEEAGLRPSSVDDLQPSAKLPGDVIFREAENEVLLLRRVAHNYCLTFPERMWFATRFHPGGVTKTDAIERCKDRFAVHRKLNGPVADYAVNELKLLRLLTEASPNALRIAKHLPGPIYAMVAIEAFLAVSGGDLTKAVEASAVADELRLVLGPSDKDETGVKRLLGRWRKEVSFREVLRGEAGNARVRLEPPGFCDLLSQGMADPRQAAKVLRFLGAKTELAKAAALVEERMQGAVPIDQHEVLRQFQMEDL